MSSIYGLVLAGGKSSRMGQDKGLIDFNGKPQREYIAGLLKKFCDEVYISCKKSSDIPVNLNPLEDRFELEGPMNGILSAFAMNDSVAWITVPVDMPYVDEATIEHLIAHRDITKDAVCFYDSDGENPEPLLAVWESKASPHLIEYYKNGGISCRNFLKQNDILLLKSPDERIHKNINTPEDLRAFQNRSDKK